MSKFADKILKNRSINFHLLKLFVFIERSSHKVITQLATIENNGIHPKHRIINYHKFFTDHVTPDDVVIDVGSGNGDNADDIAAHAKYVIGIDFSKKYIETARKRYQRDNLEFIEGDALTYDFKPLLSKYTSTGKFDKLVISNVLEHIENRPLFLKNLHSLTDTILIRIPMIDRDWLAVYKREKKLEYRLDKTHFIEYTVADLKKELDASGWKLGEYQVNWGELWGVLLVAKN